MEWIGWFYLVVAFSSAEARSLVVMPQAYPSEEACRAAGDALKRPSHWHYVCIPAPKVSGGGLTFQ